MRKMNFQNVRGTLAGVANLGGVGAIGAACVYGASNCLYNVEGGRRAIVVNRIKEKVYPEGTHEIIPWLERPIIFDTCTQLNSYRS